MRSVFTLVLFLFFSLLLFSHDSELLLGWVSSIGEHEMVYQGEDFQIVTTNELHDEEYGIYKLAVYVKLGDYFLRMHLPSSGGVPREISRFEVFPMAEDSMAFFFLIRNSDSGYPVGPIYDYYNPVLLTVGQEIRSYQFNMSYSPEDPPSFTPEFYTQRIGGISLLIMQFTESGSGGIISKALRFSRGEFLWDDRLSHGWTSLNRITNDLNMRSSPALTGDILATIPKDTSLQCGEVFHQAEEINGIVDFWFKVQYQNQEGWIFGGYLVHP